MNIRISRQMIYIISLAFIFIMIIFIFAFVFLIPSGKDYRLSRLETKKVSYQVDLIQNEYDSVDANLQTLERRNKFILKAYKRIFNPKKFVAQNKSYFKDFSLEKVQTQGLDDGFAVYEVNTSSLIESPQGFYDFLDGVNKSDNIIAVNFPIKFKRDEKLIKSSFTMHVYIASKKGLASQIQESIKEIN